MEGGPRGDWGTAATPSSQSTIGVRPVLGIKNCPRSSMTTARAKHSSAAPIPSRERRPQVRRASRAVLGGRASRHRMADDCAREVRSSDRDGGVSLHRRGRLDAAAGRARCEAVRGASRSASPRVPGRVGCERRGRGRNVGRRLRASARPTASHALAVLSLGTLASAQRDLATADELCLEASQLFRALGDRRGEGRALLWLGFGALRRRELGQARDYTKNALQAFDERETRLGDGAASPTSH
jgi:hypothetical protein